MPIGGQLAVADEDLSARAEGLADALRRRGDARAAELVLAALGTHAAGQSVAVARVELALARGDAEAALKVAGSAWEAGSQDLKLEALLAVSALALRLDDISLALTEPPFASPEHAAIRLLLAAGRGEAVQVPKVGPRLVWALRSVARQLLACGQQDLVASAQARDLPGAREALTGLRLTVPPTPRPARPPMDRAAFTVAWSEPAAPVAFGFAWQAARDALVGERLLCLGANVGALRPLFAHTRALYLAGESGAGAQLIGAPGALPVAPSRFAHVFAAGWLERASDLDGALREVARVLGHGGRLSLLAYGPVAPGGWGLRTSAGNLERAAARAGLHVEQRLSRDAEGLDASPEEAAVHLLRAFKSVV